MQIRIVLTGGPSAGKTTLIDLISKHYGNRVAVAPEAASQLFGSGFPRPTNQQEVLHTQRMIYQVQKDLEARACATALPGAPVFCDRGSLDGSAYWPGSLREFCFAMGSSIDRELSRYTLVVHLQAAAEGQGYTNTVIRTETPAQAAALDRIIADNWSMHPNYIFIPNQETFGAKIRLAVMAVSRYLPDLSIEPVVLPEDRELESAASVLAQAQEVPLAQVLTLPNPPPLAPILN